ncbi:hypothetical protein B0A79_16130 [Flavobacterium piscis]|jgi:hypothetical protein|uniref:DUF4468 domain-containing protein n=1 Tax=Flavobacterium piscis TaxID=1114874 RepID=A0ABX2XPG9_9FLAO|nr:hypothetical protein [Flavobacterium piscis]OCB78165.1 hypothetical protein FLP_00205 [Flavobacterium piscis]OXG02211.1 hypothetical protein B0A79_16130 [Flavobacterium piscis]
MKSPILLLLLAFSLNVNSQQKTIVKKHVTFNKKINSSNEKLKSFIPKGYEAIAEKKGNLNLDKTEDCILVIRKTTEETTSNMDEGKPDKRIVLLLLGQKDGSYKLAYKNQNVADCIDCGGVFGDPFSGISIKNGYFSIEHKIAGGHHWEQIITFKFNKTKNNWYLYKDHFINYVLNTSNDPNAEALIADVDKLKTVKDFGEISFQNFNIYSKKGY